MVVLILMISVSLFVAFMDNANSYFVYRFGYTQVGAGRVTMLAYLATILSSPLLGLLADRVGHRKWLILAGCLCYLSCHLLLYLHPHSSQPAILPVLLLMLLGVCFAMYASFMYPAVADLVKPSALGTAYGIDTVLNALTMAVFPLVSGLIVDRYEL